MARGGATVLVRQGDLLPRSGFAAAWTRPPRGGRAAGSGRGASLKMKFDGLRRVGRRAMTGLRRRESGVAWVQGLGDAASRARVSAKTRSWNAGSCTRGEPRMGRPPSS